VYEDKGCVKACFKNSPLLNTPLSQSLRVFRVLRVKTFNKSPSSNPELLVVSEAEPNNFLCACPLGVNLPAVPKL
jgi:hypothetical protein